VHLALRAATREDHAFIDRLLLGFNLNRAEDYTSFLNIHLAAISMLQADWRPRDREDFAQMICCLRADLSTLGHTTVVPFIPFGKSANPFEGLGIAYVLRGSRLGAAILRRSVRAALPTSYLNFVPHLSWTAFLLELESIAEDSRARDEAARAACGAFKLFTTEFARQEHSRRIAPQ
jgi:heme oxygenase